MRSLYILSLILLTCFSARSQTWCPAGATWHYFDNELQLNSYKSGVTEMKFTNTVTVNSIVCKELVATFTGVTPFPFNPVSTQTILTLRTYENNGVYLIYNPDSNIFDTIVNLNASIGDKWLVHRLPYGTTSFTCPFSRPVATVIDTGHVIINSQYLKKVVIHNNLIGINDTILEKIAGFNLFFTPNYNCVIDMPGYGSFMCYSDSNFPVYKKAGFVNCYYDPTGLSEKESSELLSIHPNPAQNELSIEMAVNYANELRFLDISGREVKNIKIISNMNCKVDVSKLENAVYFIEFRKDNKLVTTKKLIKE